MGMKIRGFGNVAPGNAVGSVCAPQAKASTSAGTEPEAQRKLFCKASQELRLAHHCPVIIEPDKLRAHTAGRTLDKDMRNVSHG